MCVEVYWWLFVFNIRHMEVVRFKHQFNIIPNTSKIYQIVSVSINYHTFYKMFLLFYFFRSHVNYIRLNGMSRLKRSLLFSVKINHKYVENSKVLINFDIIMKKRPIKKSQQMPNWHLNHSNGCCCDIVCV